MEDNQSQSNSAETCLRKAIQDIQNDPSIDPSTKARRMQDLLSASWKQSRPASRSSMFSSSDGSDGNGAAMETDEMGPDDGAHTVTYHALHPEPIMGCKHYMRNCKKYADCCDRWVSCRFCHDEQQDHPYDRFSTSKMLCMFCKTEQPVGQRCSNKDCAELMSRYYCGVCKFWDNDENKNIFHCEKCGICRVGLKEDFVHCDKCNACITREFHPTHKCIERSLECDCVICGEYLFTSTSPVMFMPCGHSIHFLCHREHMRSSYQCPVCWKSLGDMKEYFSRIDVLLESQKMPPEYALVRSQILCNDCEAKTCTKFHFVYHKCKACGSYNTKVMKTFNVENEDDDGESYIVAAPVGAANGMDSNDLSGDN